MYQNIDDNYDNPPTPNMYPNLNLNNPTECNSNTQSLNTIYDKTTQQKQIEKKVNLRVLPTLIGLYFFTILARNNVSNAAEQMEVDLGLTPDQYSTAVGVFFITYVSCQIPGNIVHKKVGRPAITFGVVLSSMGIFCCCFMLAKNLMGLVILRLFVGLAEACVYPGILYFITIWYTSEQRPRAIASVGTASGLAGGLAGILAFGLLRMDYFGLKGWQWLFLVEGLPAVIFGIVIMLTLPASPTNCTFLTEEEKFLIVSNQEQVKDTGIQLSHMTTILKNWRLWVMGLAFSGTSSVLYGINYFLPQLIANFGYSELASELLTSPASVFGSMAAFFVATMVKRYNGKTELFALAACLVATLNYGLFAACILFGHGILRYFALVFANMTSTIWYSPMLAWASSEAKGSPAQIAMGIALVNSLGNLGGIIGPKIMSHAVTQFGSFGIGILILCFVHVFSFILVAFLYFTNRKPKVHIGSPFLQPSVNITIEDTETTHLLGK